MPSRRQLLKMLAAAAVSPAVSRWNVPARAADTDAVPAFEELLKIDAHGHVFEDIPAFTELLRKTNARKINICVPGTDGKLPEMHRIALALFRKEPGLYPFVTTFDLREWQKPGFGDRSIQWLTTAFGDGAKGVKIWKEIGLELRRPDGSFLMPDDPIFDPIFAYIAGQKKTLVAHLAEPIDAWLPLNPESAHYDYYSKSPQWHLYGKPEYPPHAKIIAARDHLLEKHPGLTVVGAHLGSLEHDLEGLSERLGKYANFNVDCAARLGNLSRQSSEKVRTFFIKNQDRIVYGVDMGWKPHRGGPVNDAMRRDYVRRIDRRHRMDYEYLSSAGEVVYLDRKVQGLNLPGTVLQKVYNRNAMRLFRLDANVAAPAKA